MITEESRNIAKELEYGTPKHLKIADAIRARLRMSDRVFSEKHKKMAENEDLFQAYIPEQTLDAIRRRGRESQGVPAYRTVEIPYSYATLMTAHTYYTSVFLSRSPVFQISGRHGEAEQKTRAHEALLNYQVTVGKVLLPLFVWLLDPGKYGYGVLGHHWYEEIVRVRQKVKAPRTFLGMPIPGTERNVDQVVDMRGYVGNKAYNVRPQDFLPDPRVALVHFQKGEFCGRYVEVSWQDIYDGEKTGRYFNYDKLKKMRSQQDNQENGNPSRDKGSPRTTLPNEPTVENSETGYDVPVGFIKSWEFFLRLIPKDWGLGSGDRYELWAFNLTLNGVIFGAMPVDEVTNDFPFDILVEEVDGYSVAPKSMLERCKPLNDVITWLINTHFYNVRQTLNNQFIGDPSMIVMKDVERPGPGKFIRLKPAAYGKDVRTMLQQLPVGDVTRGHIADVAVWQDVIQRITGVNDTVMGMIDSGSRRTATEVRQSTSFGVNRLKTQCEWYSTTGFAPLTQHLIQRAQNNYDLERQFRIVGDLATHAPNFAMVTPDDIMGFFDYEPVDGTLPVDRFAQANLWQMLLGQVKDMPQVVMEYDIARIFAWVANLAGIKNLSQFRLTPDEAMIQQAKAGNVIPLKQAQAQIGNPNEPRQIPGMGSTA